MKKKIIIWIIVLLVISIILFMVFRFDKSWVDLIDESESIELTVGSKDPEADDVKVVFNSSKNEELKQLLKETRCKRTFQNTVSYSPSNSYRFRINFSDGRDPIFFKVLGNDYISYDNVFYKILSNDVVSKLNEILKEN